MSRPKRQRTFLVTLKDRATGSAMFTYIRIERRRFVLSPSSPALMAAGKEIDREGAADAFARLMDRAERLGALLQRRCFAKPGGMCR